MADSRYEAYKILLKIEKEHSYSVLSVTEALKNAEFSDSRDTAFVVSLVYGVLERKLTLDYNISSYLTSSVNKLKNNVLNLLRLGAYQILYMDKIPDSAAVNETVKLVKKTGAGYASGLVNAVLRKISANGLKLPQNTDSADYLSVVYSVNSEIVDSLISDYGFSQAEKILSSYFGRRPVFIRRNSLICTDAELVSSLEDDGVSVYGTDISGCFKIEHTGDITKLSSFAKGMFYVQDMSSQLCCMLAGAKPGNMIVDCCAAPGGKSFTLAQYLDGEGKIISCDVHEHKKLLLEQGAHRLGITNLSAVCCDARKLKDIYSRADIVLCDVPCSGFGVMGRKPEIRYKNMGEIAELPRLQSDILSSCSQMVRKGGVLLYSTCTLNKNENELVCERFLSDNSDFAVASDDEYSKYTNRFLTVFPEKDGGDGFFIAKFIRS